MGDECRKAFNGALKWAESSTHPENSKMMLSPNHKDVQDEG